MRARWRVKCHAAPTGRVVETSCAGQGAMCQRVSIPGVPPSPGVRTSAPHIPIGTARAPFLGGQVQATQRRHGDGFCQVGDHQRAGAAAQTILGAGQQVCRACSFCQNHPTGCGPIRQPLRAEPVRVVPQSQPQDRRVPGHDPGCQDPARRAAEFMRTSRGQNKRCSQRAVGIIEHVASYVHFMFSIYLSCPA